MTKFDPLRTFEMDESEWEKTVRAVVKEGFEEWDGYAPTIIAAIEQGYLDNHLQMLGKWLRDRWMFLKDSNMLAPAYAAALKGDYGTDDAPVHATGGSGAQRLPNGLYTDFDFAVQDVIERHAMVHADGIRPIREYREGEPLRGEFRAHGYVFAKDEFIGKHFTSPVPVKPKALYRIDSIGRMRIAATVVAVMGKANVSSLGKTIPFSLATQRHIFNI